MQTATQLLTVDDVAAELECSPLMIQRVIALGTLKATQAKDGSIRSFRVTRANMDAFVAAGCQKLTPLPAGVRHITNSEHWFEDKHTTWLGRLFDETVTARLSEILPEPDDRLPAGVTEPRPGDPEFRQVQIEVQESAISSVLTAAVPYGTGRVPGKRIDGLSNHDGQWRDCLLIDRFWARLATVVTQAENATGPYPPMHQLYQTPEVFKGFLDQAWKLVERGYFSATRRYHVGFEKVGYRDPKAQLVSKTDAVQTIEVELTLTMARIAAGRRAIVEREL